MSLQGNFTFFLRKDEKTSVLNWSQNPESIIRGVFDSIIDFKLMFICQLYKDTFKGHGYFIFRYAFPTTVAKLTRAEKKIAIFILFLIAPRLCNISGTNTT